MDNLSKRIKSIRESKEIRQSDVAKELNIERTNYHRIENRGDKLSIEQAKAIAAALDVSLSELLGLDAPVENEGKVKELEKRIEELESRIKDKDDRIKNVEYILNYYFDYFIFNAASHYDYLSYNIIDSNSGEILETYTDDKLREIQAKEDADIENETYEYNEDDYFNTYPEGSTKTENFISPESKRRLLSQLLDKEGEYSREIITLLSTGLIKDEIGKEFFPKLAFRKSQYPSK